MHNKKIDTTVDKKEQVLPGFEPGSMESKSTVLTPRLQDRLLEGRFAVGMPVGRLFNFVFTSFTEIRIYRGVVSTGPWI